ncbi:MAG: DUF1287 domain-containing protein [Cellvibrionaceae bacterium]
MFAVLFSSNVLSQNQTSENFALQLVQAGIDRTQQTIRYDGSYFSIGYPNGDVPSHLGVCTDVIIRSYRAIGIDLQQRVHDDMAANFDQYPSHRIWGLKRTDKNIDHRRVPNLQVFFSRQGEKLNRSMNQVDYLPGDLVTWLLPGNLPHIGMVANQKDKESKNPLIIHNIGSGPELSDILFNYKITGHYRYFPE